MKQINVLTTTLMFFGLLFSTVNIRAINYIISFSGSIASNSLDSVIVQNLTRSTFVVLPAGYALNLKDVTSIEYTETVHKVISIIPNPVLEKSVITFFAKQAGNTQINITGLDGRIIKGLNCNLSEGNNSFQISLEKGAYILKVNGNGYSYSSKILSCSGIGIKPMLSFICNEDIENTKLYKSKNTGIIPMTYLSGDQLLYKGYSGNLSTIVTDKPTNDKTINFEFLECKDADGNYYPIVKIGTQIWMAENLKTTSYRNGDSIGTTYPSNKNIWGETYSKYQWAYNGDENNADKYGRLYTYSAIADSRKIAPTGWHIPLQSECIILQKYLIANGYNFDGTTTENKIAKSLASATDWETFTTTGSIGNNLTLNNSSGFKALPGGIRGKDGSYAVIGTYGYWWIGSTEYYGSAGCLVLRYNNVDLYWASYSTNNGFSVRCIKD